MTLRELINRLKAYDEDYPGAEVKLEFDGGSGKPKLDFKALSISASGPVESTTVKINLYEEDPTKEYRVSFEVARMADYYVKAKDEEEAKAQAKDLLYRDYTVSNWAVGEPQVEEVEDEDE